MLGHIVTHGLFDFVIVDSVPAIMPASVMAGQPGDGNYGARAKLLAEELPRLLRLWGNNTKTTILLINQVRENLGSQHGGFKSTGGKALDHYVSQKVRLSRISRDAEKGDVVATIRVQADKNRFSGQIDTEFSVSAVRGVDTVSELVEFGQHAGFIHKSGAWYTLFERPVTPAEITGEVSAVDGFVTRVQGEGAMKRYLVEHDWVTKLFPLAKAATDWPA